MRNARLDWRDAWSSRARLWGVAAFAVLLVVAAGAAQARMPPNSFADLVEHLKPAVVNIATSTNIDLGSAEGETPFGEVPPGMPQEDFFDFFNQRGTDRRPSQPVTSLGSGFIIDPAGFVVTNNHVIADADEVTVVLDDNTRLDASVVGRDPKTDLALLKVESSQPLPFVQFGDSDRARVGDWVIAIGNPFGLGNTVTAGILSARGRDINAGPYDDFLQTDAPINRGNSGGPMFDLDGHVIGVNTLIYSPSGGSVGIGFATPASIVKPVIEQLRKFGRTRRGWLGVRIQTVSPELAKSLGLAESTGALVAAVIEDGPAEAAHLRQGDVILSFDGRVVPNRRALPRIVADTEVGKAVPVEVWRDGKQITLQVEIGRLEDYEVASEGTSTPHAPVERTFVALGLTLAVITDELRDRYGLADDSYGVVVTNVEAAVARESDLAPGDVILELGHETVVDLSDVEVRLDKLRRAGADQRVVVLRERGGDREFVPVKIQQS